MTKNQIAYEELQERIRANKAQEGENYRANIAREAINTEANRIAAQNVALGYANNALGYEQVAQRDRQLAYDKQQDMREYDLKSWEMYYGNLRNSETQRHNVATEQEAYRHNIATETIQSATAASNIDYTTVRTLTEVGNAIAGIAKATSLSKGPIMAP